MISEKFLVRFIQTLDFSISHEVPLTMLTGMQQRRVWIVVHDRRRGLRPDNF